MDNSEDVLALLDSGVKEYNDRKKKSKKEQEKVWTDNPPIPTMEEFCAAELKQAKEKQLENPAFDYRDFYERGDEIHFVRINKHKYYGKSLKTLKVRTVYPRNIVAIESGGECVCIGYDERDQIFSTFVDAKAFFDSINMIDEDKERDLRKKREKQLKKQLEDEGEEDNVTLVEQGQSEDAGDDSTGTEGGEIPEVACSE